MASARRARTFFPHINPMEHFDDEKFISRYRLNKETVRGLAEMYAESGFCMTKFDARGAGLTAEERMCIALRYFATGANYSLVGDFQGVHKSTVSHCVNEVAALLYMRQQDYVKFPFTYEARFEAAEGFHKKFGKKPGCIGCIDGSHIPIIRPRRNEQAYVNRKGYHSINVMIVSNSEGIVTHVDPRWPGSVNDAYVLRASAIGEAGDDGQLGSSYLLGDAGYPLKDYLFTPLRNTTSDSEVRYNRWQKRTRASVESTLGILKQRWRSIDDSGGYLHHTPLVAGKIVVACVCLHNLAVRTGMALPVDDDDEDAHRPLRRPRPQPREELAPGPTNRQYANCRAHFIQTHFETRH